MTQTLDIEHDPNWITKSTCIVTSNVERAMINTEAAKAFCKRNNVTVLQWKRKLILDFPLSVKAILYDKDERPKLFAYFVQQADRGFARSQLCTNEDGTSNNFVL